MLSKLKRLFRRKKKLKREAHQRQVEFMKNSYRPEDCHIIIGGRKVEAVVEARNISQPRVKVKHPTMDDIRRQEEMRRHTHIAHYREHDIVAEQLMTTALIYAACDVPTSRVETITHEVCDRTDYSSYDCGSSSDSGGWD